MSADPDRWIEQLREQLHDRPQDGWLAETKTRFAEAGQFFVSWSTKRLGFALPWPLIPALGVGLMLTVGLMAGLLRSGGTTNPLVGTWEAQTGVGSEVFKFYNSGEFAYFLEGTGSAIGNQTLRGTYKVFQQGDRLQVRFDTHRGVMGGEFFPLGVDGQPGYEMRPIQKIGKDSVRAFYRRSLPLLRVADWVCARDSQEISHIDFAPSPIVGSWLPKHAQNRPPFELLEDGTILGWDTNVASLELRYSINYAKYPFELDLMMPNGVVQKGIVDFPSKSFLRFNLEADPRKPRPTRFDSFGYWKRAVEAKPATEETSPFPDAWDLRNSSDASGNYYLVFVARALTVEPASPGHIYVVWIEESTMRQLTAVDAWGFYPRENYSGWEAIKLLVTVPGAVVNEDTGLIFGADLQPKPAHGGMISALGVDRFTLRVNETQYKQSRDIIDLWQRSNYTFANHNCKNFVHEVVRAVGLNAPAPELVDPSAMVGIVETPFVYLQKLKNHIKPQISSPNP